MYNIIDDFKRIYKLKTLKINGIKSNSIVFLIYDEEDTYMLNDNSFITYSCFLRVKLPEIVNSIEKLYSLKVYNYFPLCFTRNNSMIFACKVKKINAFFKRCKEEDIKELLEILDNEKKYYTDEYDDELVLLEKYRRRYCIYQKIIKKYFISEKRRNKTDYLALLKNLIEKDDKKIIDVSCGDNEDIFKGAVNCDVVGNDINLYHIKRCQNKYKNILFANDNILNLRYKENYFDVAYCKNTLHHLNGRKELKEALDNLYRIAKKIILIDIEDPQVTGGMPKFLNKYLFIKYLKDAGKKFMDFNSFKGLVDTNYASTCNISYLTFENILGKYMIAIIEKR